MNSPNQHIPVNNIDPGKNVGDGEGSVQVHLEEDLMQTSAKTGFPLRDLMAGRCA